MRKIASNMAHQDQWAGVDDDVNGSFNGFIDDLRPSLLIDIITLLDKNYSEMKPHQFKCPLSRMSPRIFLKRYGAGSQERLWCQSSIFRFFYLRTKDSAAMKRGKPEIIIRLIHDEWGSDHIEVEINRQYAWCDVWLDRNLFTCIKWEWKNIYSNTGIVNNHYIIVMYVVSHQSGNSSRLIRFIEAN